MKSLIVYKDFQFPPYLQIIPSTSIQVLVPQLDLEGKPTNKYNQGRITKQGLIDLVTTPENSVFIGDEFRTPISIIKIDTIEEIRPAKGEFTQAGVMWMRCGFSMVKKLIG